MKVTIDKTFRVNVPIEKVWKYLSDPSKVIVCVPGAKITEMIDEHTFKGAVSIKIGPIVAGYNGEVKIEKMDDSNHELEIVGKGLDVKGKGSASMKMTGKLKALNNGEDTEIINQMEISITGKLAQFGARMIMDVSNKMFDQFTNNFEKNLLDPEQTNTIDKTDEPIKVMPLISSVIKSSLSRLFKGKREEQDS